METNLNIPGRFSDRGVRHTRHREQVYAALLGTRSHPTVEELHRQLTESATDGESLSLATVYNSLETLIGAGLCRRLAPGSGSGPARYDADVSEHVHVQLPDGRIVDLPAHLSERLLAALDPALRSEIERACGVSLGSLTLQLNPGQE